MTRQAALKLGADGSGDLDVGVVERADIAGAWAVEAINRLGDGEIYLAIFSGPSARDRAEEYARIKYGSFTFQ